MRVLFCILAFCVGEVAQVAATQIPAATVGVPLYEPLQDSHLIVRGKVKNVVVEQTTLGELGLVSKSDRAAVWKVDIAKVQFKIAKVLKGAWPEKEIVFTVTGRGEHFEPGGKMIICAKRKPHSTEVAYLAGEGLGLFQESDGSKWITVTTDPVVRPTEVLPYDFILELIADASLASVTSQSDIVARGLVIRIWTAEYETGDGRVGKMTHHQFRVTALLKGKCSTETIEFVVPRIDASYVPTWTRSVPIGIAEGQEWYVFLRDGERGLHPFAGPNSLLRIEGSKVIYDNAVDYPYNVNEVERLVRLPADSR